MTEPVQSPVQPPVSTHTATQGVMLYEGKSYAVGLLWFTVQEDNIKNLLSQRIKKTRADFYCQRTHISMQQGFGWLDKGHRRGMTAAAAMVADQLVGEWHGVFEADNGWWYVQVRSDTLTPNGDRFFTSEEEAFHVFQEEMQKNVWPHAYAPEKWRLSDSHIRELSLKNMLDDFNTSTLTPTNITAIFGSTTVRNIVIGGLILAFGGMGIVASYTAIGEMNAEPVPSSAPVRSVRTVQSAQTGQQPQAAPIEMVSPKQLLQQCGEAASKLYQSLPGWVATEFVCKKSSAAFIWRQTTGTLSDAKNIGMPNWPQNVALTFNNRQMTVSLSLPDLPKIENPVLQAQDYALLYLEQNLQPLGALQIKPVIPPPPPVPQRSAFMNAPALPPPPPPPPYLEIQFLSGFGPEKIAPLLTEPGLELVQVQWRMAQAMWQYQLKWTYRLGVTAAPAPQAAAPNVKQGVPPRVSQGTDQGASPKGVNQGVSK